ncbi:MAG: thioredoxin [Ardenticatenales bacterium]|nr:thioredoxin [Ardenticatenales bacterium]
MSVVDTPITVNDDTFERWVLRSELPVALLFCTPRFAKCQQIVPLWQQLAREYAGRLRVVQIAVDDNRQWARHFEVTALPTTLWLRKGEVQQRAEGVPDEVTLHERAEALLDNRAPRVAEKPKAVGLSSAAGPVKLTDESFASAMQDPRPILVDFWAAWCGPCRMIAPVLDQLAGEVGEKALIAKLNVDENPRTAQQFNVRSIPTLLIFRNGRVVDTIVGAQPAPVLRQRLMAQVG